MKFRLVRQQGELVGAMQLRKQFQSGRILIRVASLSLVSLRHLSALVHSRLISYINIYHLLAGCQYIISFSLQFVSVLEFCLGRFNLTILETETKELDKSTQNSFHNTRPLICTPQLCLRHRCRRKTFLR